MAITVLDAMSTYFSDWEPYQVGILMGTCVYATCIGVVLFLLIAGGSFQRIREQADAYKTQGPRAFQVPLNQKPKLFEHLLQAARELPPRPVIPGGHLLGRAVELHVVTGDPGNAEDKASLSTLFDISNGSARYSHGSYDPLERIWRWLQVGPFDSAEDMAQCDLLIQPPSSSSSGISFFIRDRPSTYIIGMISIVANTPQHLTAEIGNLWLTPQFQQTYASTEAVLLVAHHLFGQGYRRLEWRCDKDNLFAKQCAEKLGFIYEGLLRKHRVVREANRDTVLYSLTNTDWRQFAEEKMVARLQAKLKGVKLPPPPVNRQLHLEEEDSAHGGPGAGPVEDKKAK